MLLLLITVSVFIMPVFIIPVFIIPVFIIPVLIIPVYGLNLVLNRSSKEDSSYSRLRISVCGRFECMYVFICTKVGMHVCGCVHVFCVCVCVCFLSFIHSGHLYGAPSSPLLLRGAPDSSI